MRNFWSELRPLILIGWVSQTRHGVYNSSLALLESGMGCTIPHWLYWSQFSNLFFEVGYTHKKSGVQFPSREFHVTLQAWLLDGGYECNLNCREDLSKPILCHNREVWQKPLSSREREL